MKKHILFFLIVFLCIGIVVTEPVYAEEIDLLRGEEEEVEIYLEGSENVYSIFGEMEYTGDFLNLKETEQENQKNYQAVALQEELSTARILLSDRGNNGDGLWIRLRVEATRIGVGTIHLAAMQMTEKGGAWLQEAEIPAITVNVLPNPLCVELEGTYGDDDWYISPVVVSVTDKDAAEIWYDFGEEKYTYVEPFVIQDGKAILTVSSDDGYGYKKEEMRQINVDTVAPMMTASIQELSWQAEDINITVESTDGTSGIKSALWAFSEEAEYIGEWNKFDGEQILTMEQDGIWYLHLKASDNAGNETVIVYGPYHKDSVKPEIVFENLSEGQLVVESVIPEITVKDDRSGIEEVTYSLDGETWNLGGIMGKGKHVLTVTAKDMAGNTHAETVEFCIYDCVEVIASAGDVRYTETASFSALALHHGEPLPEAEVEFFLNGECIGTRRTNKEGMAWLHLPMELSPQVAELTASISQDDERFLLAAENKVPFTVLQENAWINYRGEVFVRKGEKLQALLSVQEVWNFWDMKKGDITKAEICAELYQIEEDCSKTLVTTKLLNPDKWGLINHEFEVETGWYELKLYFTENSWYDGPERVVYMVVYEGRVKPDWNGEAWWSPDWKEDNPSGKENVKQNDKQNNNGKDKKNGKEK